MLEWIDLIDDIDIVVIILIVVDYIVVVVVVVVREQIDDEEELDDEIEVVFSDDELAHATQHDDCEQVETLPNNRQ